MSENGPISQKYRILYNGGVISNEIDPNKVAVAIEVRGTFIKLPPQQQELLPFSAIESCAQENKINGIECSVVPASLLYWVLSDPDHEEINKVLDLFGVKIEGPIWGYTDVNRISSKYCICGWVPSGKDGREQLRYLPYIPDAEQTAYALVGVPTALVEKC